LLPAGVAPAGSFFISSWKLDFMRMLTKKANFTNPELLLDAKTELGESPVWDEVTETLYWVNIKAGELHQFDPLTKTDRVVFKSNETIGFAVPAQNGEMILGLTHSIVSLNLQTGQLSTLAAPETHIPGNRFNDGKCDPTGRLLAGTMDNALQATSGALYSLAPDGTLKTLLTGIHISNGLTWSPDFNTFYHIDTLTRMVMAYDYDLASGGISNPREAIRIPEEYGWPDGMTSDSQGNLWVALWGATKLTKWNPVKGSLIDEIHFPAMNITSCAFGGEGLTDLHITSARTGLSPAQLEKHPHSGGLFHLETGIPGMPSFSFGS
jgi:sugar lactone lactonase YvrE